MRARWSGNSWNKRACSSRLSLPLSIHPLGGGEIQNPAHDGERHVQALGLDAILPPLRDEILQAPHVHLFQPQTSDKWIELSQVQRVVLDALLVVILLKIFGRRGVGRPTPMMA